MLRVTSGSAKGKKLKAPNIPNFRAVQDKAKLAMFSILADKVIGAKCLDLYSGSGSLGIEALSRGAQSCDFVDESRSAEETITENLRNTSFTERAEVFRQDAIKFVANGFEKYDLAFVDPFYNQTHFKFLFQNLEHLLEDNGVIMFSHGKDVDVNDCLENTLNLTIHDKKRYGNAYLTIIKQK